MQITERLYYTDPYLTEFEARVADVRTAGSRQAVVLDRTAFYPTSGGQPFDTGTLGNARVVDVLDADDGNVLHVIDGELTAGVVVGRVDWARRFEHMQQHTGQHVLSAAFDRLFDVQTTSFHLGSTASTIDLVREVTAGEIARAEEAANQVVWEDRSVTIRFVDAGEAASLPLRKEPARAGRLRIIEVEGFDTSACGGTHVARAGSIGSIVVSAWERFRGGSRIEFRCGVRVLAAYRTLRDAVSASIQLISVAPEELARGIERLQAESREQKRRSTALGERLAGYEAQALASNALAIGGVRVVFQSVPDQDVHGLKLLAQAIAALPGHAAVLCATSHPAALVVARGADVPLDSAQLLKSLTVKFGGKGGGRPELAQGGGLAASPQQILDAARAFLATCLGSS